MIGLNENINIGIRWKENKILKITGFICFFLFIFYLILLSLNILGAFIFASLYPVLSPVFVISCLINILLGAIKVKRKQVDWLDALFFTLNLILLILMSILLVVNY